MSKVKQLRFQKVRYNGFHYPKDIFADSTDFYKYCLKNPRYGASIGISEEYAKKELEFFRRFPPGEHDRLSAHNVDVYLIRNPTWVKKGKLVVPEGSLEKVLSLDFGSEIKRICEEEGNINEVLCDYAIDLGDGTVVQGTRVRNSRYSGEPNEKEISNEHLIIFFDPSGYSKRGDFCYSFDIKTSSITKEQPKEYHIKKYVKIDGELVLKDTEVARAAFETQRDEKTPIRVKSLIFTKR